MLKKGLRILMVEGSQKPPTFIQNLINGLLNEGVSVCLVGRDTENRFTPVQSKLFSRIITHYQRFNTIRILLSLGWMCITDMKAVITARKYLSGTTNNKLKIKNGYTFSKIVHHKPDIIHFQWATHLAQYENLLREKEFKLIVSLRGRHINVSPVVEPAVAALYRRVFPYMDGFHAVSQAIAQVATKYDAAAEKISVICSPIPEFFIQSFTSEFVPARTPLRILSVGRFHWKKGYGYALDAMKILRAKQIAFQYTIIAQGVIPDDILYHIHNDRLTDSVRIIQGIPYHEMIEEMKRHSVFLLPSLEEGIANVVLEAMAIGLPVVSTDCGGMREVVVPNETGLIVPRRDAEAMAAGLLSFQQMADQDVIHMRRNAWQKVKNDFAQPIQIQKFIHLYESLN